MSKQLELGLIKLFPTIQGSSKSNEKPTCALSFKTMYFLNTGK